MKSESMTTVVNGAVIGGGVGLLFTVILAGTMALAGVDMEDRTAPAPGSFVWLPTRGVWLNLNTVQVAYPRAGGWTDTVEDSKLVHHGREDSAILRAALASLAGSGPKDERKDVP